MLLESPSTAIAHPHFRYSSWPWSLIPLLTVHSSKVTEESKQHVRNLHSSSDQRFLAAKFSPWNKWERIFCIIWNSRLSLIPHNIPPCKTLVPVVWKAALQKRMQVSWWTPSWRGVSNTSLQQRMPLAYWAALARVQPTGQAVIFLLHSVMTLGYSGPWQKTKWRQVLLRGIRQDTADTSCGVGNPN